MSSVAENSYPPPETEECLEKEPLSVRASLKRCSTNCLSKRL